jgi:hypothetical protein
MAYTISNKKIKEGTERMKEIIGDGKYDVEDAHKDAEEVLLRFAPPEVAEMFRKMRKWYS